MIALLCFLVTLFASPLKSRSRLEAENAALRYQLIVLRRKVTGRVRVTNGDRLVFIQLYRWFPSVLKVITVIRPETLLRWHRAGFRRYWCWKSRPFGGRPQINAELRALIRRMSVENPLWGAPRIHGELLKLGFEVAQSAGLSLRSADRINKFTRDPRRASSPLRPGLGFRYTQAIEIRQDLIVGDQGQRTWAALLARLLPQAYQELVAAEALGPA